MTQFDAVIGADPGTGGGLALYYPGGDPPVFTRKMPESDLDLWNLLESWKERNTLAVIETILPRPTRWFNATAKPPRWEQSILRSTCILYGNFVKVRALLVAAGIEVQEVTPQVWQPAVGISPRKTVNGKKEDRTAWKNRLKARAQELYPEVKVTLHVSDAILLAHYGRLLTSRGRMAMSK